MDCPKCGENMEKGCIAFACWDRLGLDHHIDWYYDDSIEKYSKFPQSLLVKADIKFGAKRYKMGRYGLDAYICEKCGTMTVMPLPEDAENIEYYIDNSDTEV
ncbi:MAG: hypothetical protein K2J76_07430 [Oscillospiraceae bacterium]|nr:hypothetical protein [Oscillospiraceae bacterium]